NDHPSTRFERLSSDPIPVLESLARDMRNYMLSRDWDTSDLGPELAERKQQDRRAFELEIARDEDGIRWLRRDPRLLLAFTLTNRTMLRVGELTGVTYDRWRLFQLVFVVSQMSALAWREFDPSEFAPGLWGDEKDADPTAAATVVWYPTAGGK